MVVCYDYGFMVFADLCRTQSTRVTYNDRFVEVTNRTIQIWASYPHEKSVYRCIVEQDMWIVLAPFCAMRYINDGGLLLEDDALELDRVRNMSANGL